MANIAKIKRYSIANGDGLRTAVFFSGCSFYCQGCFNKELWDYNYGVAYNDDIENTIIESLDEHTSGISILGGEPLCPANIKTVYKLTKKIKELKPDKTIYVWTGYPIEEIDLNYINYVDRLIDGQFQLEQQEFDLQWRGSINQRIWEHSCDEWYDITDCT